MDETVLKFKPDRFRLFANNALQFVLGHLILFPTFVLLAILLGANMRFESLFINQSAIALGGVIGMAIGAARVQTNSIIAVSNEYVAGPSLFWGKRVHFPLHTLNLEKSSKQSIFLKLLGGRQLISTTGAKIALVERAFDKNQVEQIYQALGLAAANATHHS